MIRRLHPPVPGRQPSGSVTPGRGTAAARRPRRLATVFVVAALGLTALVGCGGQNTETDCGLDHCLVTFDRGVEAETSVLGVDAKLVGADADTVTVEVAGEQLSLSVDQQAVEVGGMFVSLEAVNDQQAVVRIGRTRSS
ncbi:hypothetical protein [Plantactinospora sp. GCM10030261]|uniref:hypothetical protein n=1 Tax=Plantactinospora sp. GCM10030261 TaxID=3273420 RepID=UPI00361157C3